MYDLPVRDGVCRLLKAASTTQLICAVRHVEVSKIGRRSRTRKTHEALLEEQYLQNKGIVMHRFSAGNHDNIV